MWAKVSEGALSKFMAENFDKTWKKYDLYNRDQINMLDVVPFVRDLMTSLVP